MMKYDQEEKELDNCEREYYEEINSICSPSGVKQVVHNKDLYMVPRNALEMSEIQDYKYILNDEVCLQCCYEFQEKHQ